MVSMRAEFVQLPETIGDLVPEIVAQLSLQRVLDGDGFYVQIRN